ncbi:MAG TPA: GAF domain-containing protein, partial [Anaerolineales bacterium]|nr:GAF domain-containing protein [Anaerolineales bacterium]
MDYVNPTAREWLELREEEMPNLEAMARRIRPSDEFLKLCASEGEARFSVNGRPMEAISYRLPGSSTSLLVSLELPAQASTEAGEVRESAGPALKVLAGLSQILAAGMGVPGTVQAILENIQRIVPTDLLEMKLWEPAGRTFTSYRIGTGPEVEQRLDMGPAQPPSGYSATLVETGKPLLISDTQKDGGSASENNEFISMRSYLGLPLLAGESLIGTLEMGMASAGAFKEGDLEILQLATSQAAAAIRNASMLEAEKRRSSELSGLAELAQAVRSTHDAHELFTRLVQSVTPLFDADILGFLVYNENRRALEAQVPFTGMPAQVVELYHVPLPSGSQVEERFLKQEILTTRNAMDDPLWTDIGFQDYARAASWRDTALIPLVSSGHPLGYLQISNHRRPEAAFSKEEMRLLNIVVNQAAPIIENLTLVQQARQRALRSESLRKISSLVTSSATADEVLRYSTQELVHLLQAEMAGIFLLDETRGVLRMHADSVFGLTPETAEPIAHLFVDETQFHFTVTGSQKPILSGHLSEDPNVLALYKTIFKGLGMESAIVVPLVVREHGLGELIIAGKKRDFFSNFDLQAVSTAASQLATVIEGASFNRQTDESMRQRADRLTEIMRVSRELNTTPDWKYLVQVVYDESLRAVHADCSSVIFFEDYHSGKEPTVTESLGDDRPSEMLQVERDALKQGDAILVADYADSKYQPPHDGIRSGLIVPIGYQDRLVGLIHLHSMTPAFFDQTALDVIQTLATQSAIALENAKRFQVQIAQNESLNRRVDMFSNLFTMTSNLSADRPLEQSLDAMAAG